MRDDDHRHALFGEALHDVEDFADHLGVERRRRLIKQHDLRLHREGARNRDALLLAARKLRRVAVGFVCEADARQELLCRLLGLFLCDMAHLHRREHDVLEHRHVREEVEALEHHADFLADVVDIRLAIQQDAVDGHRAFRRHFEEVDAPQQRTLARARRADDDDDFLLLDMEVDALQDVGVAIRFVQVFNVDHLDYTSFPGRPRSARSSAS